MIELKNNCLTVSFPEVNEKAKLSLYFMRTLRIPDDDRTYPLPPGLSTFPMRHIDDFAQKLPKNWLDFGGVMMPMYQAEALWLRFDCGNYPFAIKVSTGKINAVTGKKFKNELDFDQQDYMVAPNQPWLDGFCVKKGTIRQFVAMPLDQGYTVEEQVTGKAEFGGLQIIVYPMKATSFAARERKRQEEEQRMMASWGAWGAASAGELESWERRLPVAPSDHSHLRPMVQQAIHRGAPGPVTPGVLPQACPCKVWEWVPVEICTRKSLKIPLILMTGIPTIAAAVLYICSTLRVGGR